MSKIKGLAVTLEKDMDIDDNLDNVIQLIRCIDGVIDVRVVENNAGDIMDRVRIKHELKQDIYDVLKE